MPDDKPLSEQIEERINSIRRACHQQHAAPLICIAAKPGEGSTTDPNMVFWVMPGLELPQIRQILQFCQDMIGKG